MDREAIKARADAATEGPWVRHDVEDTVGVASNRLDPWWIVEPPLTSVDADFIANAREDIPVLLAALEKAEQRTSTQVPTHILPLLAKWEASKELIGDGDWTPQDSIAEELAVALEEAERRIAAANEAMGDPEHPRWGGADRRWRVRAVVGVLEPDVRAALLPVSETTESEGK